MHAGHPPPRSANGIFRICSSEVLTPRRQIRRTPSLIHPDSLGKAQYAGGDFAEPAGSTLSKPDPGRLA